MNIQGYDIPLGISITSYPPEAVNDFVDNGFTCFEVGIPATLPGVGIVPWKRILDGLMEAGYRGPFLFELRTGENGPYDARTVLDCFKRALSAE